MQVAGVHSAMATTLRDGTFDLDELESKIRHSYPKPYFPRSRLICVENTHNIQGGRVLPLSFLQEVHRQLHTWRFFIYGAEANDFPVLGWLWTFKVRALADRYGLSVHMDGARVMNAAVAQRVPVSTILQHAHTVSMSLSKVGHEKNTQSRPDWKASHSRCARQGLGAPVGTLLAGPREFIFQAGRCRKVLGGSMRQAGILAAAGKVALLEMAGRLEEDHHNARTFAQGEQGTTFQPCLYDLMHS